MWFHIPAPKLDYRNPEDWGKSRLTDDELRRQEAQAIADGTHPSQQQSQQSQQSQQQ